MNLQKIASDFKNIRESLVTMIRMVDRLAFDPTLLLRSEVGLTSIPSEDILEPEVGFAPRLIMIIVFGFLSVLVVCFKIFDVLLEGRDDVRDGP